MPIGTNGYYPNAGSMTPSMPIYTGPVYQQPNVTPVPNTSIAWVRGEAEAYAFPVSAGSSVLLMDRDSMVLYAKSVDMAGRLSVETFDLVKREPKQPEESTAAMDLSGYVKTEDLEAIVADAVSKALGKQKAASKKSTKEGDA